MSAIGPGDWVECVNNRAIVACPVCGKVHRARPELREGGMYQVAAVSFDVDGEAIFELASNPYSPGFAEVRFRPIYRPKPDLIETLKQPAPDAVRELEDALEHA